jgi:hypothetical protein
MKILTCSLTLLLLAVTGSAQTICPGEGPRISVYFDEAGTIRYKDSPGAGQLDQVWIYGEGFGGACFLVASVGYSVDYGANLRWISDDVTATWVVGESPTGIEIGFFPDLRDGAKFLIQRAVVEWTADCAVQNVDGPTVLPLPGEQCVAATCPVFPPDFVFANGARSQTCQLVELDIKPGSCPNAFSADA